MKILYERILPARFAAGLRPYPQIIAYGRRCRCEFPARECSQRGRLTVHRPALRLLRSGGAVRLGATSRK